MADVCTWVHVECEGVTWSVAPVYVAPVGIGEADRIAKMNGCELPTPALVDAIWRQADLKLAPLPRDGRSKPPNTYDQKGMASPQVYSDQAGRIYQQYAGKTFRLLAGSHKDVVRINGVPGLYGWHRPDGSVLQPPYTKHVLAHVDYSQGLRLCRRVT